MIPRQSKFNKLAAEYGSKVVREAFAAARRKNLKNPVGYALAICKKSAVKRQKRIDLSSLVDAYVLDLNRTDRPELEF